MRMAPASPRTLTWRTAAIRSLRRCARWGRASEGSFQACRIGSVKMGQLSDLAWLDEQDSCERRQSGSAANSDRERCSAGVAGLEQSGALNHRRRAWPRPAAVRRRWRSPRLRGARTSRMEADCR